MSNEQAFQDLVDSLKEHFTAVEEEMAQMRERLDHIDATAAEAAEVVPIEAVEPEVPEPDVALLAVPAAAPEEAAAARMEPAEPDMEVSVPDQPEPAAACSACGSPLEAGARFCVICGESVAPATATAPATKATVPEPALVVAPVPLPEPVPAGQTLLERWRGDLSWGEFFGRRVLVWIAGVVIVIGMILLYRRAVEAGWVGAAGRVALGGAVSFGMLGLAMLLRNRWSSEEGALVAAGTSIAGLYATLFAAVRMYELIGSAAGLPFAFAIAALAVVIALRWSSQPMAMLGLAGASLAPLLVSQTVTPLSAAFVVIVAAAGGVLWLQRGWIWLVAMTTAISAPQLIAMVALASDKPTAFGWTVVWQSAIVALVYWLVYQALLVAHRRTQNAERLDPLSAWTAMAAVAFALFAAAMLYDGDGRGYAILAVGAAYLALTAILWRIELGQRDLMTISWAAGATAITAGLMILVGGATLVVALALQGALHLVVARRLDEPRLQISSAVLIAIATGYGLFLAPPTVLTSYPPDALMRDGALASDLVRASIVSVIALATAFAAFAILYQRVYIWQVQIWRRVTFWAAVVMCLYAVSTVIMDAFLWLQTTSRSFENGHMVVSVAWALIALGMVYAGFRRHIPDVRLGGLVLFVAALAKLFVYDLRYLEAMARAMSFIAVGLILLAGGVIYRQLAQREAAESLDDDPGVPPHGTPA